MSANMNRVVHFEFGAQDLQRAVKFYQDVFGWQIQQMPGPAPYYLATTGPNSEPGINGGLLRHQDGAARTVNTMQVASIEDSAAKITAAGGKVVVPKVAIPSIGYLAYCTDTEGLIFGIFVPDSNAK